MSHPGWGDWGAVLPPDDGTGEDELYNPITYEQDESELEGPSEDEPDAWDPGRSSGGVPVAGGDAAPSRWAPAGWVLAEPAATPESEVPTRLDMPAIRPDAPAPGLPDQSWPPRIQPKARPPRAMIVAAAVIVMAAAIAGAAFALGGSAQHPTAARSAANASGHQAAPAFPPGLAPPITAAAAKAVLARYTRTRNTANARMDPALAGGFETASSEQIDTVKYARHKHERAAAYPAYGPASARFYIPVEPAAFPHWFAVQVVNRFLGGSQAAIGTEYLLFTQSGAGAPWQDEAEPYLLGGASVPPAALDAKGYATEVAYKQPGLSVPPSELAQETAKSLDGHGQVGGPPNLPDTSVVNTWRPRLPLRTRISDTHTQTGDGTVGLRTAGGGALLFYTDAAIVTFTAPHDTTFKLAIPGLFDGHQKLHWAGLRYLDQFATYDPPAGASAPDVVADYGGVQERLWPPVRWSP